MTVAPACSQNSIKNDDFESGSFVPWTVYNPIAGAGGSWSIAAGQDSTSGAFVAQVTMLNPDRTKYGGFLGYINQLVNTCVGRTYTLTFQYQCTQLSNGASIQATVGGKYTPSLTCASANTWYTGSLSFTATAATSSLYIEGVQNGATQSIMQFNNIVLALN